MIAVRHPLIALSLRWIGAFALLSLVVTCTPLAYYYSLPLRESVQPEPSDVIVLMSSGQIGRMWITPDAAQRTLGALWLYRRGFAPRIISSGSHWELREHQAELQEEWLIRAGVPKDSIMVEKQSQRTHESAQIVAEIMRQHGWKSAVVVTSEMDTVRVRLCFEKEGVRPTFLAVPEYGRPRLPIFFPGGLVTFHHATYEYAGLALYKLRGWI